MPARRQHDSAVDLEAIIAEIASLQSDRARIEGAGPPLSQRQAEAEAALERAVQQFERYGFADLGVTVPERGLYRYRALIGALVMLGGDRLREAERERVSRVFEASGGLVSIPRKSGVA